MCCVEVIKENIIAVQTESICNKESLDKMIDTYLDIIIDIQHDIRKLNHSIADLHDLIHSFFSELTENDYNQIKDVYKKLIQNLNKLYTTYKKSVFYPGIKTDVKEFRKSIQDLQEMENDMQLFIQKLPHNDEYKNLAKLINAL